MGVVPHISQNSTKTHYTRMITTFFLSILYGFITLVIGFLPTGNLPNEITQAFAYFLGVVNTFSYVVPVDTLLQAALVILVFDGGMVIWYLINWIIRKIPGMQ